MSRTLTSTNPALIQRAGEEEGRGEKRGTERDRGGERRGGERESQEIGKKKMKTEWGTELRGSKSEGKN